MAGRIRDSDIAEVRVVPSPSVIEREAVSRYLDVTAGVSGRSVEDVAAELRNVQHPVPAELVALLDGMATSGLKG